MGVSFAKGLEDVADLPAAHGALAFLLAPRQEAAKAEHMTLPHRLWNETNIYSVVHGKKRRAPNVHKEGVIRLLVVGHE